MKISEIFSSVQGEGPNVGKPSVFIRLAGCNQRCEFCDSKYSWKDGVEYTIEQLVEEVKLKFDIDHIVITGGEPTLQRKEIVKFIEKMMMSNPYKYKFELETNGLIFDKSLNEGLNYISVSPKNGFDQRYVENVDTIFKYVCRDEEHFNLIIKQIEELNISKDCVYIMPECTTRKELIDQSEWLVPLCIKNNVNYCPRVHLMLWDGKIGV